MKFTDKNEKELRNGDIIDIHQTVNGQNLFVVISIQPLDIRYAHDLNYKFQYNQEELLKPCRYSGEVEFEILDNVSNLIFKNYCKV